METQAQSLQLLALVQLLQALPQLASRALVLVQLQPLTEQVLVQQLEQVPAQHLGLPQVLALQPGQALVL